MRLDILDAGWQWQNAPGAISMIRKSSVLVWFIAAVCLLGAAALPCEYSVRDAAFVCYEHEEYRLLIFVRDGTPEPVRTLLEEAALIQCLGSNIRYEIVNADENPEHPILAGAIAEETGGSAGQSASFPMAILATPSGRCLPVPLGEVEEISREAVWRAFEALVKSPARETITRDIIEALSVVVLVEGSDAERNEQARAIVTEAIDRIEEMMPYFPKPVHAPAKLDRPPRLVTVARSAQAGEAVLLFSLDLDSRPADEPQVVVLHGRGRQVGWPLSGGDLDRSLLERILSISGQDCECDLPRSWMQGRLIPLRWDEEIVEALVRKIGFNPESPAVILEVSRIVGAGAGARASNGSGDLPEISLGYNEIEIGFDSAVEAESERPPPPAQGSAPPDRSAAPAGLRLAMTCLLIAAAVIIWGIVLVRRRDRGRPR